MMLLRLRGQRSYRFELISRGLLLQPHRSRIATVRSAAPQPCIGAIESGGKEERILCQVELEEPGDCVAAAGAMAVGANSRLRRGGRERPVERNVEQQRLGGGGAVVATVGIATAPTIGGDSAVAMLAVRVDHHRGRPLARQSAVPGGTGGVDQCRLYVKALED